jgi:5-methylcytosine-specific restriction endonuclease McrA
MLKKPVKSERLGEIRKRERKKKDRAFQAAVPPEGNCENCGLWRPLVGDHIIKRRYGETRHDPANRRNVCAQCNGEFESLPAAKLLKKYPCSPLRTQWEGILARKGQ